jgi:hypothetical protein
MAKSQSYYLRVDRIERILTEQSLKKWWVAEMTGVHKTTFRRWLQGKIKTVRDSHVVQLAEVLQAPAHEIATINNHS